MFVSAELKTDRDLQTLERRVFRSTFQNGLLDMFIGVVLSPLAVAPFLSGAWGDFWSSAILLPVYAAAYAAMVLVKRRVVSPRLGAFKAGPERIAVMRKTTWALFGLNVVMLAGGIVAAFVPFVRRPSWWTVPIAMSVFCLVGFSIGGLVLSQARFFLYGAGVSIMTLAGEWLFRKGMATHHGIPLAFGITSITLICVGAVLFVRFLRRNPRPPGDNPHG